MFTQRSMLSLLLVLAMVFAVAPAAAQEEELTGDFTVAHYWSSGFALDFIEKVINDFVAMHPGLKRVESPVEHEQFKTQILVQLAGENPPDAFSYWAGARVQFIVDSDRLEPINDIWEKHQMDEIFAPALIDSAVIYNGDKYLIPVTQHWVGFFYNKALFEQVGAEVPTTWDELKAVAEQFKEADIPAFALGSRERWPAQFWFDMILLRTAGPEYRARLMAGEAAYTDPEVMRAFELWKELVDAGYFFPDANAYDWLEAADFVANGEAAMTLMGTWVMGHYLNDLGLVPEEDFDYFAFPIIDEDVPHCSLGPIDGFVMPAAAKNPDAAKAFLVYLTDPEVQLAFAEGGGHLAPSLKADTSGYDPVKKRIAAEVAADPVFAFNYDLATPPPVAEVGLNAFSEFMANPDGYLEMLERVQEDAAAEFAGLASQ